MKRPCIITFHNAINEGAILQCVCLSKLIETHLGVKPWVLDYESPQRKPAYAAHPYRKQFLDFVASHVDLSPHFDDDKKAAEWVNNEASVAIFGSDEIWKWLVGPGDPRYYATPPNIYLGHRINIKKAAYAVSIGCSDAARSPSCVRELIGNFDLISVRDYKTRDFVNSFARTETVLPDPVFGVDFAEAFPGSVEAVAAKIDRNKVFLADPYFFPAAKCSPDQIMKTGMLIPSEWAAVHGMARLVVTDRFHGTVMCMKSGTPCRIVNPRNKINELLGYVGVKSHNVTSWPEKSFEYVADASRVHEDFIKTKLAQLL